MDPESITVHSINVVIPQNFEPTNIILALLPSVASTINTAKPRSQIHFRNSLLIHAHRSSLFSYLWLYSTVEPNCLSVCLPTVANRSPCSTESCHPFLQSSPASEHTFLAFPEIGHISLFSTSALFASSTFRLLVIYTSSLSLRTTPCPSPLRAILWEGWRGRRKELRGEGRNTLN